MAGIYVWSHSLLTSTPYGGERLALCFDCFIPGEGSQFHIEYEAAWVIERVRTLWTGGN